MAPEAAEAGTVVAAASMRSAAIVGLVVKAEKTAESASKISAAVVVVVVAAVVAVEGLDVATSECDVAVVPAACASVGVLKREEPAWAAAERTANGSIC